MRADYIQVHRSPSVIGGCVHVLVMLVSLLAIFALDLATELQFAAAVVVCLSTGLYVRRDVLLLAPESVVAFHFESPGWFLHDRAGRRTPASLTASTVCIGRFVSLGFREMSGRHQQVVLWHDSVDRTALRHLRILLRLVIRGREPILPV